MAIKKRLSPPTTHASRRRGSVLILVIALLVLLALIGTAYLTTTQTERYTADQNAINTEGDLTLSGVVSTVAGQIANGLFAGTATGTQYRPPHQEMPGATTVYPINYPNYDSTDNNLIQAPRTPTNTDIRVPGTVAWSTISWPLAPDSSGNYIFSSPINGPINTFVAANRNKILAVPYPKVFNGQVYPGMYFIIPPGTGGSNVTLQTPSGAKTVPSTGWYLTPAGLIPTAPVFTGTNATINSYVVYAGDAAGTGVADSCFYQLPGGPINGVTYYAATRVVDNNSAINAGTAWTMATDPKSQITPGVTTTGTPATDGANMGFFPAGIGLAELLTPAATTKEIGNLNNYRLFGTPPAATPASLPMTVPAPLDDTGAGSTSQFAYWSWGDLLYHQLARRPGNPGYTGAVSGVNVQAKWFGPTETATLAYKGALINPYTSPSILEQCLANDVYSYTNARSTPYSPGQVYGAPGTWFGDLYDYQDGKSIKGLINQMPLRPLLVGNGPTSNACMARYGNASATVVPKWSGTGLYSFGDWVKDSAGRSYVCTQSYSGSQPLPSPYRLPTKYWTAVPFTTQPVKTSINTANFSQLYLGFAQTMTDSVTPASVGQAALWEPPMAYPIPADEPQLKMFRSVFRDPGAPGARKIPALRPDQMLQLRAALAAVNTIDLRDSDDNVTSKHITLTDTNGAPQYEVEVYGTERQPYISEVFIHVEAPGGNGPPKNYMAVKLCNPYRTPMILTNWQIASLNRAAYPSMTLSPGIQIPTLTIPAATSDGKPGIITLEDSRVNEPMNISGPMANAALANSATTGPQVDVPGMESATFGNELVLLRPRRGSTAATPAALSKSTDPADPYDETLPLSSVADFVPVDQFDMTGLEAPPANQPPYRYVYRRACRGDTVNKSWNMIFPGYYRATVGATTGRYFQDTNNSQPAIIKDTSDSIPSNLNAPDGTGTDKNGGTDPNSSTYPTVPLQLNNASMAGPNQMGGAAANQYPFGGFARNGDMMQIPFIGSYKITSSSQVVPGQNTIVEMNSVTMDSALANDITAPQPTPADTMGSPYGEQIGRFCPVGDPSQGYPGTSPNAAQGMDFYEPPTSSAADLKNAAQNWHYHWTRRLFDYFDVQCPSDDYAPNVDPLGANTAVTPVVPAKYPDQDIQANGILVSPVSNSDPTVLNDLTAGKSEDQIGIEGRININTAPWPVLAAIAYVPVGTRNLSYDQTTDSFLTTANTGVEDNTAIAQAIVAYRTKNGPFQSIEDLLKVQAIQREMQLFLQTPPGPAQGSFSPGGIGTTASTTTTAGARFDFHERYLLINRISNLVTTHSDTYTCYVLVQGWRGVDTSNPTLAVQRRAAFLVDRTNVNSSNNKPTTFKIPTD